MVCVALCVAVNLGRPVLFRQRRPGLGGKIFTVLKFRTMRDALDGNGDQLPDGVRLTRLGALLRATSLDELPQLWNILRGDMSIVGPRPLLVEYLPLYTAHQMLRHDVRPGITGWAQINGRNAISWEDKFELDVWYVHNRSFFLDIKIILMTAKKVLMREGINGTGETTVSKFSGKQ